MFVTPSQQYEVVIDVGTPGLVGTIGLLVVDNQGGTLTAFASTGITEINPGIYSATRIAPAATGQDTIIWKDGIAGSSLGIEELVVSGETVETVPAPTGGGAVLGPCSAWVDGADVAECCNADVGTFTSLLDAVAIEASMLMFELSGRQFAGLCSRKVRPCRTTCRHFPLDGYGGVYGNWYWQGSWWRDEYGGSCGCGHDSVVRLAGYPVRAITEVKIDGAIVDPTSYKLVRRRTLMRTSDPGPPVVARFWPSCQNLTLDDTEPGTFSVSYTYGAEPPQLGRDAATALACELYKACPDTAGDCTLPSGVTRVVRQGITIERVTSVADMLRKGSTGLPVVDAFIAAYNPTGMRRRPAVWSPDVQRFARPEGV